MRVFKWYCVVYWFRDAEQKFMSLYCTASGAKESISWLIRNGVNVRACTVKSLYAPEDKDVIAYMDQLGVFG